MIDALAELIADGGYGGVLLLTFLETIFPPLPSELFMPMAGYVAATGRLSLGGVIACGTLGSLAGAWFWYIVGRTIGLDRLRQLAARHGRWLTLSPRDVSRADHWFDRHGGKVVLFGRMVPAIRSLVSVPAGISGMPMGRFLLLSGLGSLIWTSLLMGSGYALADDYRRVAGWAGPVSNVVVALIVGTWLWRAIRFRS